MKTFARRIITKGAAAAIVSLALLAFGAVDAGAAAGKKVINVGFTNDPATVNPLDGQNVTSVNISRILFLSLVEKGPDLNFQPRLAQSVTTKDNRTFTVALFPAASWSDGKPVTSDDVIFTLNLVANPKLASRVAQYLSIVEGTDESGFLPAGAASVSGIKRVDDKTLQILTKYPVTLDLFNDKISENIRTVPKHILEKENPETVFKSAFIQRPTVSDGPFLFKDYQAGQYLSLTANKGYFRGSPKVDKLNFKILPGTQITAQLESGEIDMNMPQSGPIPTDDYDRIDKLPNIRTIPGIPSAVQVLFINNQVVDKPKARQAISLAINRALILKSVLKGQGETFKTPMTSVDQYLNEKAAAPEYDPALAKKLLAESGWDASRVLVFSVPTGNTTREQVSNVIAEELKAVGFNVKIQKADLPTTLGNVQKIKYDISIIGMPDVPKNQVSFLKVYVQKGKNWTGYSNPVADELIQSIETQLDSAKIRDSYFKLQDLIAADAPVVGIYAERSLKAVNKRVTFGEPKEYGAYLDLEKWDVQ